jgi:predicted O-methyltransferase YrrM
VAAQERYFAETLGRLAPFGERSEVRRADSIEAAAATEPASLDFVYIDADHEYESVCADIEAWHDRIRPGGLLCGHDYYDGWRDNAMYGVARAVDEFCAGRGLQVKTTLREHPEKSWFVPIPERAG